MLLAEFGIARFPLCTIDTGGARFADNCIDQLGDLEAGVTATHAWPRRPANPKFANCGPKCGLNSESDLEG
jgi:hypothetical protein